MRKSSSSRCCGERGSEPISAFDALLLGHLVGDFLLQTRWMAKNKSTHWGPLCVHAAVYTAAVTAFAQLFGGLSAVAVALIFVSHVALDWHGLVSWWTRHVQGVTEPADAWVGVVADQVFHLLVLAAVAIWVTHA